MEPEIPDSVSLNLNGKSCWTASGLVRLTMVEPPAPDFEPDGTKDSEDVEAPDLLDLSCNLKSFESFGPFHDKLLT